MSSSDRQSGIEDILTSIRRLVAETDDRRPPVATTAVAAAGQVAPVPLLLTQSQRVPGDRAPEPSPPLPEPELVEGRDALHWHARRPARPMRPTLLTLPPESRTDIAPRPVPVRETPAAIRKIASGLAANALDRDLTVDADEPLGLGSVSNSDTAPLMPLAPDLLRGALRDVLADALKRDTADTPDELAGLLRSIIADEVRHLLGAPEGLKAPRLGQPDPSAPGTPRAD